MKGANKYNIEGRDSGRATGAPQSQSNKACEEEGGEKEIV
jgi:hypothetical protein